MERHYYTPEELLEINEREQRSKTHFDPERSYCSPEKLLEINEREQRSKTYFESDYRKYYTAEEYFDDGSLSKEEIDRREEEVLRRATARERKETNAILEQERKENVRFDNLPVGQQLYEIVFLYGRTLSKNKDNAKDLELSKRILSALSEFNNRNLKPLHEIFEELKSQNNPDLIEALPYWNELLLKCEQILAKSQETKKIEEDQKFKNAKGQYKNKTIFAKIVDKLKTINFHKGGLKK